MSSDILIFLSPPLLLSFILTLFLCILALKSYSRTGPKIKNTIEKSYWSYAILTFMRLSVWCFVMFFLLTMPGLITASALSRMDIYNALSIKSITLISIISIAIIGGYFFSYKLLYLPSALQTSSQFRFSRLIPFWRLLSPTRLTIVKYLIFSVLLSSILILLVDSYLSNNFTEFSFFISFTTISCGIYYWACNKNEPRAVKSVSNIQPNIIMLGVDTLRIDRLGQCGYPRDLTPNIDKLSEKGILFKNCIIPLARTAPSLASLFSALWPHKHLIRDNYPDDIHCNLPLDSLIDLLNNNGYTTSAISDWAGADIGKIQFGFKELNIPQDQWNLKLLIKQGPAYLRLFLSLFAHNKFGKLFLPELYYLAGTPLTSRLGLECRQTISRLAEKNRPFFINLFTSTTHVPFASEYPYYNLFTPVDYNGDSRFIRSGLNTPEQIIESQVSDSNSHDINQIFNLYDSCVKEFDDEVGKIVDHIEKCGLRDNTYIVLYSDHGTDFFETECWGQGNTLIGSDPSSRIPLIICGPGLPENVKFSHVCRSIDFMPTMLDILGMEIPKNIDGVSLLPYLKDNSNPNLYAYQETGVWMGKIPGLHPDQITYPDIIELLTIPDIESGTLVIDEKYYPTVIEAKNRSIQNDRWKLLYIPTYHGPVYQLYDLKNDPYRDVIDLYPDIVAELKPKLDEWIFSPTTQ